MTPSTRQTSGSNNGEEVVTKQYVDDAIDEIRQTLAAMNNTITTLSIQTTQMVNHGTGRQANQFDKLAKVEFPKFQGDDVRGWVFMCEQFFLIDNTPPEEKLIIQRFGSVFEDPMADLKNAKYNKTAKEYQDLFDTLLYRVDVSEDHALSLYLEATLEAIKKKNKPLGSQHVGRFGMSSNSGSSNKPALLPFSSAKSSLKPNPATALKSPVRKQLIQKEHEEKRAKNLCFYYDKKFVPGHKCEGQLFSLVVLPRKELDEEFEDA
nr:hypothetical protein [Tanacetum cinerariifolium]